MAKYDITYACGHTQERQLFGKETDRQRFIVWASHNGQCAACNANDEQARIAEVEAEHDLVTLIGSPKQIAWARKIRAVKMVEVAAMTAKLLASAPAQQIEQGELMVAAVMQYLRGAAKASYWIDNRDTGITTLLNVAYKSASK